MTRSAAGFALALGVATLGAPAGAQPYEPQVGRRHADFTLPTIGTGKPMSLSDLRGKKVLLIQFASW